MEQKINLIRLKKLRLTNFRGFKGEIELDFHDKLTVLIGENGAGKSAILEALAKLFSIYNDQLLKAHRTLVVDSDLLEQDDVNTNATYTQIEIDTTLEYTNVVFPAMEEPENAELYIPKLTDGELIDDFAELNWSLNSGVKGFINDNTDLDKLVSFAQALNIYLKAGEQFSIPIAVYYPSTISLNTALGKLEYHAYKRSSPFDALEDTLNKKSLDFEPLFRWFRWQERRTNVQAKAVFEQIKKAITQILNDDENKTQTFTNLYVEWENNEDGDLTIYKAGEPLKIKQLSSGEQRLLFLVANLAYRLATANPISTNPLEEGRAIVLIDEIDLHLHPRWQRKIVPQLLKTFPNCQFVVTTHSVQVLGEIENKDKIVYLLNNNQVSSLPYSGGLSISNLATRIFGDRNRSVLAQSDIDRLFQLIENEKDEEATTLLRELQKKYGETDEALLEAFAILH